MTNTGVTPDTYNLAGSGVFFGSLSTMTTAPLGPGAFEDVTVTATVPCGSMAAEALTLTATSQAMGAVMASDSNTVTAVDSNFGGGGAGTGGYFFANSLAICSPDMPIFNWVDISATGTDVIGSLADDNLIGPFPIGFTFTYFGTDYTQFYISSNGWITTQVLLFANGNIKVQ